VTVAEPVAGEAVVVAEDATVEAPVDGMAEAAAEPIAAVVAEPVAAGVVIAEAAPATEAEIKWEEIWRPRRRGRAVEGERREKRAATTPASEAPKQHRPRPQQGYRARTEPKPAPAGPAAAGENRRTERRDPRRDGAKHGKPRREERPRVPLQASPPGRKGGFDPDSPFAALSSLKAQLDKRTQE
jgi:ATP-dependent RNA helicase SUPV3L1/SUV3